MRACRSTFASEREEICPTPAEAASFFPPRKGAPAADFFVFEPEKCLLLLCTVFSAEGGSAFGGLCGLLCCLTRGALRDRGDRRFRIFDNEEFVFEYGDGIEVNDFTDTDRGDVAEAL